MVRLYIRDNYTGNVHEYGTNRHDGLVAMEDGSLHYMNLQCGEGSQFASETEGYSFCYADGSLPDPEGWETGEECLDIGGANAPGEDCPVCLNRTRLDRCTRCIRNPALAVYTDGFEYDAEEAKRQIEEYERIQHERFLKLQEERHKQGQQGPAL